MVKTKRNIKNNSNKTKKCPIGLKPIIAKYTDEHSTKLRKYSQKDFENEFLKELLSKFAPHSIKPEDNFYDYINYQWLKNISLEDEKKYIVQIDDFRLAQHKVYEQLDKIILDYIKNNNNKLAKNLKNFYDTVIEMNPINNSKKLSKEAVLTIDKFIEENNVWKLLAFINSDEMLAPSAPFTWSLNPDDKQPDTFRCYITPHSFFVIDLDIYYDDGKDVKYKTKYRNAYNQTVKKVFDTCLGKGHGLNCRDVFDVEVEIFNTLGCIDITSKEEELYNKVSASDSLNKYGFDWPEFSKNLGFSKTPNFFITSSLNYLKCGSDLITKNWNSKKWRTYWIYLLLRRIVRITRNWEHIIYDFHGKFQRGQEQINKSDAVSASLYMSIPFNTFLTNEYMKNYADPQTTEYVKILSEDLLLTFRGILEKNTWLSPKTKKYALYKLDKFKFVIGKPDNLRPDPDLDYSKNLYENLKKIMDWRHNEFIHLEGKSIIDIPMMDWTQYPVKMTGTQAYIVNASYTPSKNTIYINQGYIQKPFVDLDERGIEYNLAHIGFTLGHEMSHGFDDWGSKYDAEGKLNDWWTLQDKNKFKSIQKDIIKQYEDFAARDGIKFDAAIGVGEDMADISGMAICDQYLRHFQLNNSDIIPIRNLGFQALYTYFALQQRQFVGKKALTAQLKTNPHPLDKYRCNIPLSRSKIFRALFNVKKGDGMWWHNTDTIW
jgi:endothelin-converting enzyme/putative endopeptidase